MKKILLLEDDKSLNRGISFKLKKEGYQVNTAFSVAEAKEVFNNNKVHLIISDVGLPDGDGFEFCDYVRSKSDVYIMMLTALDSEVDIVTGYEVGVDDYITKPFSLLVLISKVNAVMKRINEESKTTLLEDITYRNIKFNYLENKVIKDDEDILLSNTESKLLKKLMDNMGQVITKDQLLEALWDVDGNYVDENTIAVNIRRLRQKIEENPSSPTYIKNVRGVGYTFEKCGDFK